MSGYTNKNSPAVAISALNKDDMKKIIGITGKITINKRDLGPANGQYLPDKLFTKNDRSGLNAEGGHFLCVKILLKQTFPRFSTTEASVFFYPMDRIEKRGYT